MLVKRNDRRLGITPLEPVELAMGSYLVILKADGYADTLYPVYITRNKAWVGTVKLLTEAEIGEGFVYVPGGPFIKGGGSYASRSEPHVESFGIARHPVTMQEYLVYLKLMTSISLDKIYCPISMPSISAVPTMLVPMSVCSAKASG